MGFIILFFVGAIPAGFVANMLGRRRSRLNDVEQYELLIKGIRNDWELSRSLIDKCDDEQRKNILNNILPLIQDVTNA